jgi:N-carbamoyl-L-amino-acid hydrolase
VLAALEVLRAVEGAGIVLPVTLEAIDFTDEEGTLVGLLGSFAVAGTLDEALATPRGGRDRLVSALAHAGLEEARLGDARREPRTLAAYLELHIEQGPVLEQAGVDIGVVTAIVGSRSFTLAFGGAAAHAGTTPMDMRRDAGLGAARFVQRVHDVVRKEFPGAVATVGRLAFEPGAFNIVPARARLALEFRSGAADELDRLERRLLDEAQAVAKDLNLDLAAEPAGRWEPTPLDESVRATITEAAASLGLSTLHLASGAGHDAQALAGVTRAGMIFVPSVGGVSHQPGELTEWQDCVNGANVLLHAVLRLAST